MSFVKFESDMYLCFQEEKQNLENQLAGVPQMTHRLRTLCKLLGEDPILKQPEDLPDNAICAPEDATWDAA